MLLRLLCAVLMIGVFAGHAQAATYWESLFNAQDCNWQNSSGACLEVGSGTVQIDTAFAHEGAGSAKYLYNFPQTGSCLYGSGAFVGCGGYWDRVHTSTSTLWRRVWVRLSSDFVVSEPTTKLLKTENSSVLFSDWMVMYPNTGTQIVAAQIGPHSSGVQGETRTEWSSGFLQRGVWQCWETGYVLNSPGDANGQLVMYLDGVQIMNLTNVKFRPSGDSAGLTTQRLYRQYGQGQINFDQYAVGDTRIGCGTSVPVDTTPPAQVTGLAVASDTATSITYTWTANTEIDLAGYVAEGCAGEACTNFASVGTIPAGTNTFTWTGLSANSLYRLRVKARDSAVPSNTGTASSIVDETTDAASVLPTVTAFSTTATGGTITYTGTPTDFRIAFGGTNGDGTFWNSQIIRTLAQVPAGVLSFNWPLGTSWACAFARDAVAAEDPINYRCNSVTPAAPGGGSSSAELRELSSNPRWLTLDGTTAIYRVGISGGDNCNASFCGLQDQASSNTGYGYVANNLIPSQTISDTFDGTAADLGTSWTGGYTGTASLEKVSGVVQATAPGVFNSVEARSEHLFGNQFAKVTIQTITGAGYAYMRPMVNMSEPGGALNGYACAAIRNGGGQTSRIERVDNNVSTVLVSENATTWASTDTNECRRVGKYIYLYRNGSLLLTASDATYRNGRVGYLVAAQTTAADATITNFTGGPVVADYVTALDTLVTDGGNWVRYWTMEQSRYGTAAVITAGDEISIPYDQFPYQWTGTTRTDTSTGVSLAVPIYDVTAPNQAFYDRVVARVDAALARGITPIITMFSGGHLAYPGMVSGFSNPFYSGNNINGISCDTNANGNCEESHTLTNGNINNAQRQYVDRLVQALGNRPVILEVSNEDQSDTTDWQNMIMERVRTAEATYSTNAHVIFQSGFVYGGLANSNHLFANSRNDAVSPLCTSDGTDWDLNPPANDGTKLIFYDSDHTGYADTCGTWTAIVPWRLFTRAIYPIYLSERESGAVQTAIKAAMAQTKLYSTKINLATAYPETGTSIFSTGYGLFTGTNSTTPNCSEYIMLMPSDGSSTINLAACSAGATFNVTYLNLTSGAESSGGTTTGGASRAFNPAGSDPMVILLELDSVTDVTAPVIINCTTSPAGVLPAGTTSVDIVCTTDENATVKMDSDPDIAYASQDTTFGTTGTTAHSQSVGSLSDGTSYTRYVRASDGTNATTVDYPVSWSVAADAVSTIPADVTNLRGTLDYNAGTILWQWDAVSGAASYLLEISLGAVFLTAVESSANSGTTYTQSNLTVGAYTARIKAINGANEQSAGWAGSVPVVTELPPTVTGVAVSSNLSSQVVLSFTAPSQSSLVSIVERSPTGCTTWALLGAGATNSFTDNTVSANTLYCYRVKFSNPVFGGTSASWSDTLQVTTPAVASGGLIQTRTPVPFGVYRLPRN